VLAKDTSDNMAIVKSSVFNLDNIKPTITINGSNPIDIEEGSPYSDAGATASDNIDGNLTANIIIDNDVNTNAIGTYTVTYNVTDSSATHPLKQ
jgi:hypothetical protein